MQNAPDVLERYTFNGTVDGTEIVVGLAGTASIVVTPDFYVPTGLKTIVDIVPVQWEIKNDSTTDNLRVRFGSDPIAGAVGNVLANYIVLLPGQSYTQQKRSLPQEFNGGTTSGAGVDLLFVHLQSEGPVVAYSGTVETWAVG